MMEIVKSYAYCQQVAKRSGSNFYRSFALLSKPRRMAMMALYAFARVADDATDGNSTVVASQAGKWDVSRWHAWIDFVGRFDGDLREAEDELFPDVLRPMTLAIADSIARYRIPAVCLHDILDGVSTDDTDSVQLGDWQATRTYCERVASSVGVACLSIWAKSPGESPDAKAVKAALDCGVAFQLTNILRDLHEDALRGRIYLPMEDLYRFEIAPARWLNVAVCPSVFALNELGDWRGLVRLQIERAKALYNNGWYVADTICNDGRRMFSLMWHTYRQLLKAIEQNPESIWQSRISVSKAEKLKLVVRHLFTPLFEKVLQTRERLSERRDHAVVPSTGSSQIRVAVIGAGLAGLNAASHLARHGCQVTLVESKHRIGGRVGSYVDPESSTPVDYCQHVGMHCCTALRQWIEETDQKPFWTEQNTLHFVSDGGRKIRVAAWWLPAPYHLAGLLVRWPQLRLGDRIRVGRALMALQKLKLTGELSKMLALEWLCAQGQNEQCIQSFWETILVSALGEQIGRVTLGAMHKVLVDGFAAHRRAYHLLVPNRPLSELLEQNVTQHLAYRKIALHTGVQVRNIEIESDSSLRLRHSKDGSGHPLDACKFDAVICAVPWNKVVDIMPESCNKQIAIVRELQSSPITGIHTWWDRAWLQDPHAILINRLCQWVFPAPEIATPGLERASGPLKKEHYYQIVVSASRNLPSGNPDHVLRMVKQDLAEVFPASAVASMLRGKVITDPNAVFSVSKGHEDCRLDQNRFEDQRIWIAGDWTETGWPATMEGALRSGAMAAQGLLRAFGRDAELIDDEA